MTDITLAELAAITGGVANGEARIRGFATDSREVPPGSLFLAIKGDRVDGHDYVAQALATGATATLSERSVDGPHVVVENLVEAISRIGQHYRKGFHGPVIGVTGSAGKTTTKEFIAAALAPLGSVLKTPGNKNSEYTSPLLWCEVQDDTKAVVVEMAMRGFGQIKHLAEIAKPTIGVVTNIGYAHLLQMGDREGIARAKGELLQSLPNDGASILWREDEFFDVLEQMHSPVRTFGFSEFADCRITDYRPHDWSTSFVSGSLDGKKWKAKVPAVGRHLALNAAAAVLVAAEIGLEPMDAARSITTAVLPPMRMETRDLKGATILLDTYNASPPSMIAAIESIASLTARGHRKAVVGEMRELGSHSEIAHRAVGEALATHGIDEILFIGEQTLFAREAAESAGLPASRMRTASSLDEVKEFLSRCRPGDAVLVKGSRALELERALEGLC